MITVLKGLDLASAVLNGGMQVRLNTIQYNFIAKCQYSCTRNVLWCQVHSSHIHSNRKTSLNYNSKQTSRSWCNKSHHRMLTHTSGRDVIKSQNVNTHSGTEWEPNPQCGKRQTHWPGCGGKSTQELRVMTSFCCTGGPIGPMGPMPIPIPSGPIIPIGPIGPIIPPNWNTKH